MNSSIIQLLVLAGIAVFLILKLKSVLGTRDGFERKPQPTQREGAEQVITSTDFTVVEGGRDRDITDNVPEDSPAAEALARMKKVEPSFSVTEFLGGSRSAYEWILTGFEKGDMESIAPLLSKEVLESFQAVIEAREREGLTVEATFVGLRELSLQDARFDPASGEGEVTVRFVAELTSVIRNRAGEIVEGSPTEIKRQRDVWTFARKMGAEDPNWQLVATSE